MTEKDFKKRVVSMLAEEWKGTSALYSDVVLKGRIFVAALEKKGAHANSPELKASSEQLASAITELLRVISESQHSERHKDDFLARLCIDAISFHVTNAITAINMAATQFPAYPIDSKFLNISASSLASLEKLGKFMVNPESLDITVKSGKAEFVRFIYPEL
ncbi:MAG TPA: hypothetical protein PLO51_00410 [Candidatus Micrarchaeota archaeon]|nr:hypothetical protein [Candidatus Micrarchaeota archaeon]